mgnify:CR=1 FL=1
MNSKAIFIAEMNSTRKYYLKAVTTINNNLSTTLTSYPTPEGTPMSDNAYREPYSINVSLISSELTQIKNIYYYDEDSKLEKTISSEELKNLLNEWKENFTRLILQTRHYQFTNMIITNMSWSDDSNNLGQFNPSVTFSECRVASVYSEKLGPFEGYESEPKYNPEMSLGNSNGNPAGEVAYDTITGALGGAAAGAAIGSVIPGIGTAIGAAVGGVWGAISSFGKGIGWW